MNPVLGIRKEFVKHISSPYDGGPLEKIMGKEALIRKVKLLETTPVIVLSDSHGKTNKETILQMTFQKGELYTLTKGIEGKIELDTDIFVMDEKGYIPVTSYDSVYDIIPVDQLEQSTNKNIPLKELFIYGFKPHSNNGVDFARVIHTNPVEAFALLGNNRGLYERINRVKNDLRSITPLELGYQQLNIPSGRDSFDD